MLWPASRHHQNQVVAQVQMMQRGSRRSPDRGGTGNPAPLARPDGIQRLGTRCARLDLDEDQILAATRNQIDFSGSRTSSVVKQAISFGDEPGHGQPFCPTATGLGLPSGAGHRGVSPPLSARARA
jgi:hypothetical protein